MNICDNFFTRSILDSSDDYQVLVDLSFIQYYYTILPYKVGSVTVPC